MKQGIVMPQIICLIERMELKMKFLCFNLKLLKQNNILPFVIF